MRLNNIMLFLFVSLLLVGTVSATPSLTNVLINTTSGGYLTNEDINLTYTTDADYTSVDWKINNNSIWDAYIPFDTPTPRVISGTPTIGEAGGADFLSTGGKFGGGYNLSSTEDDRMNFSNTILNYNKTFSTCIWVKRLQSTNGGFIRVWDSSGTGVGASWTIWQASGRIALTMMGLNESGIRTHFEQVSTGTATALNDWSHVCVTVGENVTYYLDGEIDAEYPNNLVTLSNYSNVPLRVGGQIGITTSYDVDMIVDEVRVTDKVLTAEQIKGIYESNPTGLNYRLTEVDDNISANVFGYNSTESVITQMSNYEIINSAPPPSLTNVIINTTSGEYLVTEDINLTFNTDAVTYSVNWKKEGSNIYDMYIPFDTTTVKDIAGNAKPTNYGAVFNTTNSKYSGSYYFNGSSYIDTGKSGYTDMLTTCTWADIDYTITTSSLIGNWHYGGGISGLDSWILYYQGGYLRTYIVNETLSFKSITYQTDTLTGWHHFCLRYNSSHVSLFMDGENVNTQTHTLGGDLRQTGKNITIGVLAPATSEGFIDGYLDEVFTVGESFSDDRIKAIYDSSPNYLNYNMHDAGDNISAEVISYGISGGETIVESDTKQIQPTFMASLSMTNQTLVNIQEPININVTTNYNSLCKFAYNEFDFSTQGTSLGTGLVHEATIAVDEDEIKTIFFKCEYDGLVMNNSISIYGVDGSFNNAIVTMGDSIFWDTTQPYRHMTQVRDILRLEGGPAFWGIDEINSAINAGCMSNLTAVCESPVPTVEMYQTTVIDNNPRYIVWETIVNDAYRNGASPVSKAAYKEVYNEIADNIRTQLPNLEYMILTTPAPTSATIGNSLSDYSDVAREYAILYEYPFFEMTYLIDWNQTYIKDAIHFNPAGHDIIAENIVEIFKNPDDYTMSTSDWNYYKYCGLTEGIILDYNFSSPDMNCYGNDGGWPGGVQDWLIIKNIKETGFTIERADENFTMTTSARYEPNTDYDISIGGVELIMNTTSDGRFIFEFESQLDVVVSINTQVTTTDTETGINTVKYAAFAGFGLIAIALLATIGFMFIKMFNDGFDTTSLIAVVIMAIGLAIVLFVGYIIISSVANGVTL